MAVDTEWHWTPRFGDLVWEDYRELRSAEYYAHVWSPYEIPRAIELEHQYHYRTRYSSVEFSTVWSYRKIDFEEEGTINCEKYKTICSNCFEDPELRADVIKTSHMNKRTCKLLREFLYGSYSEESKHITCSDKDFWLLLFGSMGTTDPDLETDPMGGYEDAAGYDEMQPVMTTGMIMEPVMTTGMIMETKVTRRTWKRCSTSFLLSIMGCRIQRKCE